MPLHNIPTSPEALALTPAVALGIGGALIVAGRKLFWLFVGAVGFFTAARLGADYFGSEHQDWVLIGSIVIGIAGAVLAVFVQKVAVALAGAVTAVFLLDQFFRQLAEYPHIGVFFLMIAAIVGAVMMVIVFDWALIFLTSLLGAHLIAQVLTLPRGWMLVVYVSLIALGVGIQSQRRRGRA